MGFKVGDNGIMRFFNRICVPDIPELEKLILEESHESNLNIHQGATNMYEYLKRIFLWPYMKNYAAKFVYSCLAFQKSKIEH